MHIGQKCWPLISEILVKEGKDTYLWHKKVLFAFLRLGSIFMRALSFQDEGKGGVNINEHAKGVFKNKVFWKYFKNIMLYCTYLRNL